MNIGALFGLATALVWGTGDFLSRKPSAKIGSFITAVYVQPFGLLLLFVILLASGEGSNFALISSHPFSFALNLTAGVISFAGLAFLFEGYSSGVMSVVAPIAGSYPAVSVMLSVFLLGTVLTPLRAFSILGVIVGIVLTGVKLSELRIRGSTSLTLSRNKLIKGADYGLLTCFCAGISLFIIGVVTPTFGLFLPSFAVKLSETISAIFAAAIMGKKFIRPTGKVLLWLAIIGASDAAGFASYSYGIIAAGNNIPIVVTLSGLVGVVTVLLARIFYKEKLEKIQLIGILIIFSSVAAILYF